MATSSSRTVFFSFFPPESKLQIYEELKNQDDLALRRLAGTCIQAYAEIPFSVQGSKSPSNSLTFKSKKEVPEIKPITYEEVSDSDQEIKEKVQNIQAARDSRRRTRHSDRNL